jgi:hypothetical protein
MGTELRLHTFSTLAQDADEVVSFTLRPYHPTKKLRTHWIRRLRGTLTVANRTMPAVPGIEMSSSSRCTE